MAVKLRLQRQGTKKRPFYFIVVADSRSPRDGKFIKKLGTYDPLTVPATIEIQREESIKWLENGAIPSNTVRRILSFKGVIYLKHLYRGVKLNLFSKEQADEKFKLWLIEHNKQFAARQQKHKAKRKTTPTIS